MKYSRTKLCSHLDLTSTESDQDPKALLFIDIISSVEWI